MEKIIKKYRVLRNTRDPRIEEKNEMVGGESCIALQSYV